MSKFPYIWSSSLQYTPQNFKKLKPKQTNQPIKQTSKKNQTVNLLLLHLSHLHNISSCVLVALRVTVCHSISFYSISLICKYSLQWVISLVQGFWFLLHHHYWVLTKTILGNPWLSWVMESLKISLYSSIPSWAPTGHRWGRCGPGWKLNSLVQIKEATPLSEGQSYLFYIYVLWTSSPIPIVRGGPTEIKF